MFKQKYWWNSPSIRNCKLEKIYGLLTLLKWFIWIIKTCAHDSLHRIMSYSLDQKFTKPTGTINKIKLSQFLFFVMLCTIKTKLDCMCDKNILKMHIKRCQHLKNPLKLVFSSHHFQSIFHTRLLIDVGLNFECLNQWGSINTFELHLSLK